jgi:hypothetical protein
VSRLAVALEPMLKVARSSVAHDSRSVPFRFARSLSLSATDASLLVCRRRSAVRQTTNVLSRVFQGARIWLPDHERIWRAVTVFTDYDGQGQLEVNSNERGKVTDRRVR